jgi:hypothetical protein
MHKELSVFAARLRETIQGLDAASRCPAGVARCSHPEFNFDSLALELFALQCKYNPAYRKICEARNCTPEAIVHWMEIPAVPAAAFKELELSGIPPHERTAVFHSSGTTAQQPSRHYHCPASLELYETSLWRWFLDRVLPDLRSENQSAIGHRPSAIFLTPPPEQAPHSSLVHMFETVRQKLEGEPAAFLGSVDADGGWTLDFEALAGPLSPKRHIPDAKPVLLLGTAFSFVHLLDYLVENDSRLRLPKGSRIMETGGYKNRSRSMPKTELHALITARLGVSPENIICEYGMSELSSQAYGGETGIFQFPPWARVQITSPETGLEVAEGETGLIRVFDLANVFSVMAVQTEDLGIRRGDGFELIGRAQLAEPRGCSLMTA